MSAPYIPQEGSTAWKVIEFLTTNPDEALSADDVSAKFDVPKRTVHTHLSRAISDKVLKRTEDLGSGELVYALDQGHPAIQSRPAAHPVLPPGLNAFFGSAPSAAPAPTAKRRRTEFIDTSKVVIDKNIPLLKRNTVQTTDWVSLLARMDVGDSVELPVRVRSSVTKCAVDWGRANGDRTFAVRKLDSERLRLWRTA